MTNTPIPKPQRNQRISNNPESNPDQSPEICKTDKEKEKLNTEYDKSPIDEVEEDVTDTPMSESRRTHYKEKVEEDSIQDEYIESDVEELS